MALGRAWAQDARPLDLDQTRTALASTEAALRDKNIADADLQALRAQNDTLALALQGAIADLTPRLAASAKRLAELTPKTGETAPTTDVAAKELESEKKRHDTLDANLRAARAMLLQTDDISTRISAARRQLFARQTFARSSSVLDPQLWTGVWREVPIDADYAEPGRQLARLGRRAHHSDTEDRDCGGRARAGAGRRAARMAHPRILDRDPGACAPSRLRRALAASGYSSRCDAAARRPLACGERARRVSIFPIRACEA